LSLGGSAEQIYHSNSAEENRSVAGALGAVVVIRYWERALRRG